MKGRLHKTSQANPGRLIGQPVCVVLTDGSYYVGTLTDADRQAVTLNGARGPGRLNGSRKRLDRKDRAQVSGFLGSLLGGGALASAPGPWGGLGAGTGMGGTLGFWGRIWPGIRFGIGMIQTILPLLGMFKI